MPLPLGPGAHLIGAFSPYLRSEHRPEPVPPEPHRFVAQIDTTLMEQVLDVPKRQRKPDIQPHRQAKDFGRYPGMAKWVLVHAARLAAYRRPPSFF